LVDGYHLALFVHLCALLVAISLATLVHFAEVRMRAARTLGELRQWGAIPRSIGKYFPLATLTLVASGAYMVQSVWTWHEGWIIAALVGVVLLLAGGVVMGSRGSALGRTLAGDPHAPVSAATARLVRDPLARSASYGNTALSIGIVFIMVNKPPLLGALVSLAIAIFFGVVAAHLIWRGAPVGAGAEAAVVEARSTE
jgi:hypothetical protein